MRVSAHTSLYAPHIGGIETMVREMGGALEKEGHEFGVVTKRWPVDLPTSDRIDQTDIHRVPAGYSEDDIVACAQYLYDHGAHLMNGVDVIHAVGMRRPLPMLSAILGSLYRIPVVSSVCGLEVPNPGNAESERLWQQGLAYMPDAYRNMSEHTAVSGATREYTEEVLPEYQGRIGVLHAGIDYDHYASLPVGRPEGIDQPYFMSLRRLEAGKGIDVLIEAYARLLDESASQTDLVIAGDGPERQTLEDLVVRLRLSKRVHFIGSIGLDAALGMLKGAEATIVPSTAEAGGLVNTEANAVGCALIASDVGGIREYTTDGAALFVKPGDSAELAQALRVVSEDKQLKRQLVEHGKVFAEGRDWSNIIGGYVRLYEEAQPVDPSRLQLTAAISQKVFNILERGYDKF